MKQVVTSHDYENLTPILSTPEGEPWRQGEMNVYVSVVTARMSDVYWLLPVGRLFFEGKNNRRTCILPNCVKLFHLNIVTVCRLLLACSKKPHNFNWTLSYVHPFIQGLLDWNADL